MYLSFKEPRPRTFQLECKTCLPAARPGATAPSISLTKSLEMKQEAKAVLDSIHATELGHFPDGDVADSLWCP